MLLLKSPSSFIKEDKFMACNWGIKHMTVNREALVVEWTTNVSDGQLLLGYIYGLSNYTCEIKY